MLKLLPPLGIKLTIAHRMSTIGLADRIAVLDDGRMVACGRHGQLIADNDIYRPMVELQTTDRDSGQS